MLVCYCGASLALCLVCSEKLWINPFGISDNVAVIFPVSVMFGVTGDAPTAFGFSGGLSIINQEAFLFFQFSVSEGVAMCMRVNNFDMHKLVSTALCRSGGDTCLGGAADVLSSISLEAGTVMYNLGASAVTTKDAGSCALIPIGYSMDIVNLTMFEALHVPRMCVAVTVDSEPSIAANIQLDPLKIGSVIQLTNSTNPACSNISIVIPPDSPCAGAPAPGSGGPKLLLYSAPSSSPPFALAFDGHVGLLNDMFKVDVCVQMDTTKIYADFQMQLTSAIQFEAMIAAPLAATPPKFAFQIGADLSTTDGIVDALAKMVQDFTDDFNALLEDGARSAKEALQKAYNSVQTAKGSLDRTQKSVDNKFAKLIAAVRKAQTWVDGVDRSYHHHKHRCGWRHPGDCIKAGKDWAEKKIAQAGLWAAEKALKAIQGVVDAGLEAAQSALSGAQALLTAAQSAVDAAVQAVEGLNQLLAAALSAIGKLFDLKELSFGAQLENGKGSVDFQMTGIILGQTFNVAFSAEVDLDNILDTAKQLLVNIMSSVFSSNGLPSPSQSTVHVSAASRSVNNFDIMDDFEMDEAAVRLLLQLAMSEEPTISLRATSDAYELASDELGGFFLPKLNDKVEVVASKTDYVMTPPFPNAPGMMDALCTGIQEAMANMSHTAATIDLADLPATCTLGGVESSRCLTDVVDKCVFSKHTALQARRFTYQHPRAHPRRVSMHQAQFMSTLSQKCTKNQCLAPALAMAQAEKWYVTLRAPGASGSGPLPELHLQYGLGVEYAVDFSDNAFNGTIPSSYGGPGLTTLNLANNWLTAGVESLLQGADDLQYLDLSSNYALALSNSDDCFTDAIEGQYGLLRYNVAGSDKLVPPNPARCQTRNVTHAGTQIVFQFPGDAFLSNYSDLCSACPVSLTPVNCTSHPCVNTTVLASLMATLQDKAQAAIDAASLPLMLNASDLELLAVDAVATSSPDGLVLATLKVQTENMTLPQAQTLQAAPGSDTVVAGVACPPGLIGSSCEFDCFNGWARVSPSAPATDDTLVENATAWRLGHCDDLTTTPTCPYKELITPVRNVAQLCPADTSATPSTDCTDALAASVTALQTYANVTVTCVGMATSTAIPACVRGVLAQRAVFCPGAPDLATLLGSLPPNVVESARIDAGGAVSFDHAFHAADVDFDVDWEEDPDKAIVIEALTEPASPASYWPRHMPLPTGHKYLDKLHKHGFIGSKTSKTARQLIDKASQDIDEAIDEHMQSLSAAGLSTSKSTTSSSKSKSKSKSSWWNHSQKEIEKAIKRAQKAAKKEHKKKMKKYYRQEMAVTLRWFTVAGDESHAARVLQRDIINDIVKDYDAL